MIHLGKDVKLNVCPILVTLHHDYVFEGPCRMGKDFELTKEFDDMANAELIKGAHEELAENLTSPHFNVMEPIWIDRNEEFLVTPEILDKMLQGKDDVDIYMIGPMGRLSDLVIDFVQKAKKPIITIPGPQCMQIHSDRFHSGQRAGKLCLPHLEGDAGFPGGAAGKEDAAGNQSALRRTVRHGSFRQRYGQLCQPGAGNGRFGRPVHLCESPRAH